MIKIALAPADKDLIWHWVRGGAAIGAGLGAATALVNQLGEKTQEISGDDDPLKKDTLRLHLGPKPKIASTEGPSMLRSPLAILGGLGAGVGTAGLITGLYQWYKKKVAEKELEDEQNAYLNVVQQEPKSAAAADPRKSMSIGEIISSAPGALAALTALAAGVITNRSLQKNFPDRKSAIRMQPRRVVVQRDDDPNVPGDQSEEDIINLPEKSAAAMLFELTSLLQPSGQETDFDNLIKAAATGQYDAIHRTDWDLGILTALATVGGHSLREVDPVNVKMASRALAEDDSLRESVSLLAALEYRERAPWSCLMAESLTPSEGANLVKWAAAEFDRNFLSELPDLVEFSDGAASISGHRTVPAGLLNNLIQSQNGIPKVG